MSESKFSQYYDSFRQTRDNMLPTPYLRLAPPLLSNPSNYLKYLPFVHLVMFGKPFAH